MNHSTLNSSELSSSDPSESSHSGVISPAIIDWHQDEQGHIVPISRQFGDVYYSMVDGLAESRYVFIQQNQLPKRFTELFQHHSATFNSTKPNSVASLRPFTIAELGFGTGLNLLATWQLWRQIKSQFTQSISSAEHKGMTLPRLHIISTEKYPLTHEDLARSLSSWQQAEPELQSLIERLLLLYPSLIEGCHRLHLDDDVTLDLWLGDATANLAKLDNTHGAYVDAWYLDGFAPSCNESLWAEQIFTQVARLSAFGTTAATFSCAGIVKRGLRDAGFTIKKVKDFGRKREMLTAALLDLDLNDELNANPAAVSRLHAVNSATKPVCIIGAGVSGLMSAWSLAQRGINVELLDKTAPLAGASGNPRGLLAPKMTPIHHVAEHLHTSGYLYSSRLYQALDKAATYTNPATTPIFEATGAIDLLTKANVNIEQIAEYPDELAQTLPPSQAQHCSGLSSSALEENLYLPQAGLVNPQALAHQVLAHPLITFRQSHISRIESDADQVVLYSPTNDNQSEQAGKEKPLTSEVIIIAASYDSCDLDDRIFDFRKIRGQLSWFIPTADQLRALPKIPLKYGGYCARFVAQNGDEKLNPVTPYAPHFLLGASFVRNDTNLDIRHIEHAVNRDKLLEALPELTAMVGSETVGWQARVGIRAQTPDYHPLVGPLSVAAQRLDNQSTDHAHSANRIWTTSGMGSKGYAFAPICAEALADMMTGAFAPLSHDMIQRLSPSRARLKTKLHHSMPAT